MNRTASRSIACALALCLLALGVSAHAGLYDATVLADNPRIYLRVGETSGLTAYDSGPYGGAQDGTYLAGPALGVAGILADDTAVGLTPNQAIQVLDPFQPIAYTLEAWLRADAGVTTGRGILVRTAGDPNGTWSHQLRITNTGLLQHYTFDGSVKHIVGTTTVEADTWYHVVGTATNGDRMRLYVNGALEAESSFTLGDLWTGGNQWLLGTHSGDAAGTGPIQYFDGTLDEIAVYDYALTADQIQAHYAAGVVPEPATTALMGAGLLALLARRRRRRA